MNSPVDIEKAINKATQLYSEVEIDMEEEEFEVKRQLFEEQFRLYLTPGYDKKLQVEEFKEIESHYDVVKDHLQDEKIHT